MGGQWGARCFMNLMEMVSQCGDRDLLRHQLAKPMEFEAARLIGAERLLPWY